MAKLHFRHPNNTTTTAGEGYTQSTLPRVLEPVGSGRFNKDIRISLAYALFEEVPRGNVLLVGTPRSGRTTSVIAESYNRGEPVLVVEPTIRIAKETVTDALNQADKGFKRQAVIHIPSNRSCTKIKAMIEEYPILNQLPVLPLPELCFECEEYIECEYMAIHRAADNEIDVITLTTHKLIALMLSPNPVSTEILEKLRRVTKNVIFDECHKLEREETKRVTLLKSNAEDTTYSNFEQYESLRNEYKTITSVVDKFKEIAFSEEVKTATNEILNQAIDRSRVFEKHLRKTFPNDNGDVLVRRGQVSGTHNEIVKLTKTLTRGEGNEIKFKNILMLYDMLAIVTAPMVAISTINNKGSIEVQIVARDHIQRDMITEFFGQMSAKRRIILTSGSVGSFDYGQLFPNKINKIVWGKGGDPKNANSKMMVLADHKMYTHRGRDSLYKSFPEIVDGIIKIKREFYKITIVAMNSTWASDIKKALETKGIHLEKGEIDYYNSTSSMGVESDYRAMITVGIAHKPANTYDAVTEDQEDSYIMYQESLHADTWQTINRVKDPDGKKPSVVFMLGTNVTMCQKISTWGMNRVVKVDIHSKVVKSDVLCRCQEVERVASPIIAKCKTVEDMISKAKSHCLSKN